MDFNPIQTLLFRHIFHGHIEIITNHANLDMEKVLDFEVSQLQDWHETLVPRKKTHHIVHGTIKK